MMQTLGPVCVKGYVAWQKCHADSRVYVIFMVKPAIGPAPYLAVVDDYGQLVPTRAHSVAIPSIS